ncbi:hypothetical protein TUMSATVNIG3_15720 [Vibrio nigripulchritudo]|nr:hypothetical protein TUMSATVNIG3_15720 [Vibrio nigripulchritudo]
MKTNLLKPVVAGVIALGLGGWLVHSFNVAYEEQPMRLQGQIEAQQYNISSKVAGRIDQVMVSKGDEVANGDLIFTIYSPELDAKLEQALASKEAAGALAEEAEKGAREQQIQASKDQWQKAKAASDLMEKTYNRINNLYKDGVVAEQKRDEALTQWQAAKYTESAAYQMYELAKEGARDETKRAAAEKSQNGGWCSRRSRSIRCRHQNS